MPLMQRSHGRNKSHPFARPAKRARGTPHFVTGGVDFQRQVVRGLECGDSRPFDKLRAGSRLSVEHSSTLSVGINLEFRTLHAAGTHLTATCALASIPPTIPLLRRIATASSSELR